MIEKKYETTSSRAYDVYSNVGCRNDELQHPTMSRNFQRKWHKVFDLDCANALFWTDIHLIYKIKCSKVACWYKKYRMHFWRKHMIIYNFDIYIYIPICIHIIKLCLCTCACVPGFQNLRLVPLKLAPGLADLPKATIAEGCIASCALQWRQSGAGDRNLIEPRDVV